MDEDQIRALVQESVTSTLQQVLSGESLTKALQPLAEAIREDILTEFEGKLPTTPASDPGKPGDDLPSPKPSDSPAVRAELRSLKKALEAEKQAREAAEKAREAEDLRSSILSTLSSKNVREQQAALKLLQDSAQFKRDDGKWYAVAGDETKTLDDAVSEFLATPVGGLFVAPSGTQGAGSKESKGEAAPTTTKRVVSDAEFAAAFGF